MGAGDLEKEERNSMSPTRPFLDTNNYNDRESGDYEELEQQRPYRPESWARRHRTALAVHGFMVLFYISLMVSSWKDLLVKEHFRRYRPELFSECRSHCECCQTTRSS
jgi:hypothetical protein